MDFAEQRLYHQIHPLKLATDWSTGLIALVLLWRRRLVPALVTMFLPGIMISLVIARWVDLEPYRSSPFGEYVKRSMTPAMEAVRLAGYGVMALGAWQRRPVLLPVGLLITLFGWLRGWLVGRLG